MVSAPNAGENNVDDERRWSEFLLPAVRGASDGNEQNFEDQQHEGNIQLASTLRSTMKIKPIPSYMKAKSGVRMDPDRFRRRKQMILEIPEARMARKRIESIATNWDPNKNGQLLGFDTGSLDPTQFKELFRRNFGVLLNPKDLGILVSLYDKTGEGRADSQEFMKDFWHAGREGRASLARQRVDTVRRLHTRQSRRLKERADRMSQLKEVALSEYAEHDVRVAISKITEVAARYDATRDIGFHQLERGGAMGPTTFREQLRTIFGVRLTRAELGALVSEFNLDRNGMIDAKEFAYRFHCLGRDHRAAKLTEGAARDERARRRKREHEEALAARMIENSKCKIKWDFTESELKRGRALVAKAACFYDRDRLGSDIERIAQMKMDPTAFRAQLLQNFRVRLGPGELGAMFTEFDKDNSKLIDGTELMTAFFRMGRDERAKRLAEAEEARHRIDRRKKGFRRRLEERFVEQTTAKVVWPTLPNDPYNEDFALEDLDSVASQGTFLSGPVSTAKSTGQGFMQASQECELGEGDGAGQQRSHEDTGGGSATRLITRQRTPKISASIAEFLGQIEKEELTIRAMTSHQRRRPRDDDEDGGDYDYSDNNEGMGSSCGPPFKRTNGRPVNRASYSSGSAGGRIRRRSRNYRTEAKSVRRLRPGESARYTDDFNEYIPAQDNGDGVEGREEAMGTESTMTAEFAPSLQHGATGSIAEVRNAGCEMDDANEAQGISSFWEERRCGTAPSRVLASRGGSRRSSVSYRDEPSSTGVDPRGNDRLSSTRGSTAPSNIRDDGGGMFLTGFTAE